MKLFLFKPVDSGAVRIGDEFVIQKASEESLQRARADINALNNVKKTADIPAGMKILRAFLLIVTIICAIVFVTSVFNGDLFNGGLGTGEDVFGLFFTGISCAVGFYAITRWEAKKSAEMYGSTEYKNADAKSSESINMIYRELQVPENVIKTDVFSGGYSLNKVEISGDKMLKISGPVNHNYIMYVQDGKLMLVSLGVKYAFDLANLKKIHTISENLRLTYWNCDVPYTDERFAALDVYYDDEEGGIWVKKWHALELEHQGEKYAVAFPSCSLPEFEKLTDLKAEEPVDKFLV